MEIGLKWEFIWSVHDIIYRKGDVHKNLMVKNKFCTHEKIKIKK